MHGICQLPSEIKRAIDWYVLFDQEDSYKAIKAKYDNEKIFEAYLYHQSMYNKDSEKKEIVYPDGRKVLVKPPIIFKRDQEIPKVV
jgi:hypothetical protein